MKEKNRLTDIRGSVWTKLLVFIIVFAGVITAAWIFFLPILLTGTLQKRTGFDVKVTSLTVNPFRERVEMTGLLITNPPSFARSDFVEVRSFYADAELKSFFSNRPVINLAQIDVAKIVLVRNSEGTLNATLFQNRIIAPPPDDRVVEVEKKPSGVINGKPVYSAVVATPTPIPAPVPEQRPMNFLIKRLDVKLDKVVAVDYTGEKPSLHEFNVNFSHTYLNVTDYKQLLTPVTMKSFTSVGTAIGSLIPGDVGKTIGEATKQSTKLLQETGKKSVDALKSIVDTLEENKKP